MTRQHQHQHHRRLLGGQHDEMAAAMIAAAAARPARKRKSVNHYSDDNPSTFTVKKRKRGGEEQEASPPPSPPREAVVVQEELPDSRTGRRRRRPHWLASSSHSTTTNNTTCASMASSSSRSRASQSPLPTKKTSTTSTRRKDPPPPPPSCTTTTAVKVTSAAAGASLKPAPPVTAVPSQQQQRRPSVRFLPVVVDKDDQQEEILEVSLAHSVAIAPILKVSIPEPDNTEDGDAAGGLVSLLQQRYDYRCVYKSQSSLRRHVTLSQQSQQHQAPPPLAHQRQGLSMTVSGAAAASASSSSSSSSSGALSSEIIGAPPAPTWKCCKLASEQRLVKGLNDKMLSLPPACLTCFAVRSDNPSYWLAGDAAGCILLYSNYYSSGSSRRPIQVVETLAHEREEQRTLISKTVIDYPNVIYKAAWRANVVVAWTEGEVQAINVGVQQQHNNETIFSLPLVTYYSPTTAAAQQQRQQPTLQSLELHPRQSQQKLLWRPAHCRLPADVERHVSLYLIDFSNPQQVSARVIHPKDVMDPDSFHCHAMVWETEAGAGNSSSTGGTMTKEDADDTVDNSNNNNDDDDDRVLMVAQYDDTLQLLRLNVSTGHVLQRVALPKPPGMASSSNNNNNETSSSMMSGGAAVSLPRHYFTDSVISLYDEYFFLCTGRGIRCYETSTLTFLSVYGESVALHGKTLGWQACFWIPEPHYAASDLVVHAKKQQVWLERSDELATRHYASSSAIMMKKNKNKSTTTDTTTNGNNSNTTNNNNNDHDGIPKLFSNMLLVGVPHPTRGPQELQSTLYVWKPGQVLPLQTVQAPMGGGLLGLHIYAPPKRTSPTTTVQQQHQQVNANDVDARILTLGWRMVCATQELGQAWEWQATMQSNFAGTMYPVGYQIIDDNVEYIEDEDELDQPVYKEQPEEEQVDDDEDGNDVDVDMAEKVKTTKKDANNNNKDNNKAPLSPSSMDADLQEALRRSMMDATPRTLAAVSNTICVLNDDDIDDENDDKIWIPSRPDPSLRRVFEKQPAAQSSSSPARHFGNDDSTGIDFAHHDFLRLFPNIKHVVKQTRHAAAAAAASSLTLSSSVPLKRQDSYSSATSSLGRTTPAPSPPTVPTMTTTTTTMTATTATTMTATAVAAASTAAATAIAAPPKMKGKRSRTANVEALLQASIDPLLKHKMGMIHKTWANGQGSRLIMSQAEILIKDGNGGDTMALSEQKNNDGTTNYNGGETTENGNCKVAAAEEENNPIQQQSREEEEKELAMELLLLSPTSAAATAAKNNNNTPASCHVNGMMAAVNSPSSEQRGWQNGMTGKSEPSAATVATSVLISTGSSVGPNGATNGKSEPSTTATAIIVKNKEPMICAACHGRMVMHRCGKRDQPVDFEALACAEKEREAEEEAERQRLKVEKRRAAEAKRRETRKKKKELEERKRREEEEEERLRQLEAERLAQEANSQEGEEEESEEEVDDEQQAAVMDTSLNSAVASAHHHHGDNDSWTQSTFQPAFSPLGGSSTAGGGCGSTRLAIPKFSEIAAAEHHAAVSSPAASHAFTTSMDLPQPVLTSEPLSKFYARRESLLSDHSSNYSSSGHPAWPSTTMTTTSQFLATDDTSNNNYASTGHPAWPATTPPVEDNHNSYVSTGHPAWLSTTTTTTATEFYVASGFSSNNDDLKPSRTISASDGDALAALAGLANIMPVATENDYNISTESNSGGWLNNNGHFAEQDPSPPTIPVLQQQHGGNNYDYSPTTTTADRRGSGLYGSYDYAGSADRRSAIHAALTSQYASEESGNVFGDDGGTMQPPSSSFGGPAHNFSSSLSGSHAFLTDVNNTNNNNINTGDFYHHHPSSSVSHLGNGTCDDSNRSGNVQNSYLPFGPTTTATAAALTFGSNNTGNEGHTTTASFYSSSSTTPAATGHADAVAGIGSSHAFRKGSDQQVTTTSTAAGKTSNN